MIFLVLLLLALVIWVISKLALDLPGLENHKPWVQILGIATTFAVVAFAIVMALGWGRKPKRSADWWRLKICTEDISWHYQPIVYAKINNRPLTDAERKGWFAKAKELLDSQIENPVLLENDVALENWRQSQNVARIAIDLERTGYVANEQVFRSHAEGVMKGVHAVQISHILLSDEPGSPNPRRIRP